jgi:hypothetical protein
MGGGRERERKGGGGREREREGGGGEAWEGKEGVEGVRGKHSCNFRSSDFKLHLHERAKPWSRLGYPRG